MAIFIFSPPAHIQDGICYRRAMAGAAHCALSLSSGAIRLNYETALPGLARQ
jgi:hypothetical protein